MSYSAYDDPFARLAAIRRREEREREERAFLNGHGGDRELEYARFALLQMAKREGVPLEEMRNALLLAHLHAEGFRLAQDAEQLGRLVAYVTREIDPREDETDYFSMSPEEFAQLERRLRERRAGN